MEDYTVVNMRLAKAQQAIDDWIARATDPSEKAQRAMTALQIERVALWTSREVISQLQRVAARHEEQSMP